MPLFITIAIDCYMALQELKVNFILIHTDYLWKLQDICFFLKGSGKFCRNEILRKFLKTCYLKKNEKDSVQKKKKKKLTVLTNLKSGELFNFLQGRISQSSHKDFFTWEYWVMLILRLFLWETEFKEWLPKTLPLPMCVGGICEEGQYVHDYVILHSKREVICMGSI